ncbi:MAG TPA: prefoldin subunit beta [Thermoplasmata archaeon]|jgi:prefoldin beta subunit
MKEVSPQLQNQIAQYQQLQQQLQVLTSQRIQLEAKLREIEGTLEELGKLSGNTQVYKSIGMLLVRQDDREVLKKELEEHKETLTVRVKSVQRQEKALSERYESLGEKIRAALGGGTSESGAN